MGLSGLKRFLVRHPRLLALACNLARRGSGCHATVEADAFRVASGNRTLRLSLAHAPYLPDAMAAFDSFYAMVEPDRAGVVDFSRPAVHTLRHLGVDLFITGLPEETAVNDTYLEFLGIQPGDTIVDAGAYCGLTAYLFAQAVGPAGRVIAVEADPTNYRALARNVEHLRLANVTPVHAALWSTEGTVSFAGEGNQGSAVVATGPREENIVEVAALTLDQLCRAHGVERVHHLKMDIEGAEYAVIPASTEFLRRHRPRVALEVHRARHGRQDYESLERVFKALGYAVRRDDVHWHLYCDPRAPSAG